MNILQVVGVVIVGIAALAVTILMLGGLAMAVWFVVSGIRQRKKIGDWSVMVFMGLSILVPTIALIVYLLVWGLD